MRKYSIIFFIRQSLSGLFMNGLMTATSVFILMSCLILMGCFGLLIYNININLQEIDDFNKIVVFIGSEYNSEEEIERIKSQIDGLDNVSKWVFVPNSTALNRLTAMYEQKDTPLFDPGDEELASQVQSDNPIRNSIEIEYRDISKVGILEFQLQNIDGIAKIRNQADLAETIQNLKNVVMLVLIWFLIILFGISIAIILNTIRLSVNSRRNEIIIMRYIGATNFFILFPFLLEGIIIGIIAAVVAYLVQWYIYGVATDGIIRMEAGLTVINFSEVNIIVFLAFLFTGVLSGLLGSSLSSHKYLKV